ncbi:MAG: hypothetical protein AB7K24_01185, partial [Gemmataceae bacterium]
MATVSTRPSSSREEAQRQVQNPLQQLSGYIRFYVCLEGAAVLLLYFSLWFWVGLFLDYGLFKMFGLDWVQVLPVGVRVVVLLLLLAGALALAAIQMVGRVMREFRPASLALVLERRFPKLLGDRLITAVEMSEPGLAERYGYSKQMVDQTCLDAADRVAQVPVRDVFNWGRLYRYGFAVIGVNLAFYLFVILFLPLMVAMFGGLTNTFPENSPPRAVAAYFYNGLSLEDPSTDNDPQTPGAFAERLGAITPIWFERNILIRNVPWPRRAHLTVLYFPSDGILRVGRNDPPLDIRVRALKWVIADTGSTEGWRPLMWNQQEIEKLLPGIQLPDVPASAQGQNWRGTVDEVDLLLDSGDGKQRLDPRLDRFKMSLGQTLAASSAGGLNLVSALQLQPDEPAIKPYQDVIDRLQELAGRRDMRRTMRKLIVPEKVLLLYNDGRDQIPLIRSENNEYTGSLVIQDSVGKDPKGNRIRFTVQGEDYYTPYNEILVKEAAQIGRLSRDEEQPAYLYYRTGDPKQLVGLRQHVRDITISGTGDVSSFPVPAGTNAEIIAQCDKDLKQWVGLSDKSMRALHSAMVEPVWAKLKPLQATHEGKNRFKTTAEFKQALAELLTPSELESYGDKIVFQAEGVRLSPRQGSTVPAAVITQPEPNVFRIRFENITTQLDFNVVFTDADDVTNERHIIVRPEADTPPGVEVQIEHIRKTAQGHYLITPSAMIPFSGKVRDAQGLSAIEYQYGYTKVEDRPAKGNVARMAAASILLGNQLTTG